jgi:integrase
MAHQSSNKNDTSRRSPRGEGSIYQRADGRWVAQVPIEGGKRKLLYRKTEKEAMSALRKAMNEQEQGTLATGPQQTLKAYLTHWLEEVHKPTIRLNSYIKYQKLINSYIIPSLGNVRLQKLTPQQVLSLYRQKEQDGLSPKTINSIHGVLHKALDNAVRWNLVSRNVCDLVSPPRLVKHEIQTLTMEQAHQLLVAARGHRLEVMLMLALTTGMRRGELLGLKWGDIDFENHFLQVRRSLDFIAGHGGYIETEPKTTRSRRKIILPDFVIAALKQQRVQQLEWKLKAGDD